MGDDVFDGVFESIGSHNSPKPPRGERMCDGLLSVPFQPLKLFTRWVRVCDVPAGPESATTVTWSLKSGYMRNSYSTMRISSSNTVMVVGVSFSSRISARLNKSSPSALFDQVMPTSETLPSATPAPKVYSLRMYA